jgi:hypothetical protein
MQDTKHLHTSEPIESDGVNYGGIVWFVVILTATTLFCQALVWGGFKYMEWRHIEHSGVARAPLSAPAAEPSIDHTTGHVLTGTEIAPQPSLMVDEAVGLAVFRKHEEATLSSYAWVDQTAGIARIPIDEAKKLMIARGYPTRTSAAPAAAPAAAKKNPAPAGPATHK